MTSTSVKNAARKLSKQTGLKYTEALRIVNENAHTNLDAVGDTIVTTNAVDRLLETLYMASDEPWFILIEDNGNSDVIPWVTPSTTEEDEYQEDISPEDILDDIINGNKNNKNYTSNFAAFLAKERFELIAKVRRVRKAGGLLIGVSEFDANQYVVNECVMLRLTPDSIDRVTLPIESSFAKVLEEKLYSDYPFSFSVYGEGLELDYVNQLQDNIQFISF